MTVTIGPNATALNRLKVTIGANAITPASGESIDAAGNFGLLVIGTASLSGATGVLATIVMQNPSFSFATRTATLLGVPLSVAASASGTAALAELRDKNGVAIYPNTLTVGTSGTNFIIGSTTITSGDTVTCTAGTLVA